MKNKSLTYLLHVLICFFLTQQVHAQGQSELEILRPVFLTPSATTIDLKCKKTLCLNEVKTAKKILTKLFHSLNQNIYHSDSSAFKYLSPNFKASINQNANSMRELFFGDAEQVLSFAVKNYGLTKEGSLHVEIYLVSFNEGYWGFEEVEVVFARANNRRQTLLVDGYRILNSRSPK